MRKQVSKMVKLTKWEAGQELIKAFDEIAGAAEELQAGSWPEQAKFLSKKARDIAKYFNKFDSHDFGLPEGITDDK